MPNPIDAEGFEIEPEETETAESGSEDKEPKEPDYKVQLDEERKKREELETRLNSEKQVFDEKIRQVERLLGDGIASARAAAAPPQQEPLDEVTDQDFVTNAVAAAARVAGKVSRKGMEEFAGNLVPVINALVDTAFDAQMDRMEAKKYFPYVKHQIEDFFEKNPKAKLQKNAVRLVYENLVGAQVEQLEELHQANEKKKQEKASPPPLKADLLRSSGGRPSLPNLDEVEGSEARKLSDDQNEVLAKMKRAGFDIDDAEYLDILEGKKLPYRGKRR